jgi:predicted AAA+ superfamily ATPase
MYKRLIRLPSQSLFLFGARGTGKTTLLKAELATAHFINLLNEQRYQAYLGDIDLFRREVAARPKTQTIVVDEVQRLPDILNYVHDFIESEKRRFVLTGSSARKLKRKGVNLLAGRALVKHLYPLLPTELGSDFDLKQAMRYGTLPIVVKSNSKTETLEAYTQTYLSEEIKAEALVKNLQGFARFLPIAALFHGQTLNISNVASESGVSRTTVHGFFDILVDTLIGSFLPAFQSRPKVREVRHPKFYFFDAGVVRTIKRQSGSVDDDEKGFLLEGFVHHCLRAYGDYFRLFDELSYWSPLDAKALEVDFLVRQGRDLFAFEVKAKTRLRPEDLKGLRAVSSLQGIKRRFVIYLGDERQDLGEKITALPFDDFYRMLAQGRLVPKL